MNQQVIDQAITNVKILLKLGKIKECLKILEKDIAPISEDLESTTILLSSRYTRLANDHRDKVISAERYGIDMNILTRDITSLVNDSVESELEVKRIMGQYSSIYTTTSKADLEKIQGPENTLVPMSWIHKCIEVSKSVCQVVRDDGGSGTGWLLEGGWMMTNFHVIPNIDWISRCQIVFDYEEDIRGSNKQTTTYKLQEEGALFSPVREYDYALIKVLDEGSIPLSKWGFLEIDTFSAPQAEQRVAIIQHPKGEAKQIALTQNKIINVDGSKIFYKTDTERGSSGSPVLNQDWKVIALHHAGLTEEEGGLVVNSQTGERKGANEGILIKSIMADIEVKRK